MPRGRGRARGRARGRQRSEDERARRPGEAPEIETPGQDPTPGQAYRQPEQDAPVEQMGAMSVEAEGGVEVVYQREQAHGGARPKTTHQPPPQAWAGPGQGRGRGPDVPIGQDHALPGAGDQRGGIGRGAEGGRHREESFYAREEKPEPDQEQRQEPQERERRRPRFEDQQMRPAHVVNKQGSSGREITLTTNYFSLNFPQNLVLYQYHVDYNPPCESKKVKIALLYVHENLIGRVHAFDGAMLFMPRRLHNQVTEVYSTRQSDNAQIRITIKMTNELPPNHPQAIQVFNILFRRQLKTLQMTQVQRHYFDFNRKIAIPKHGIQVIPGVAASILHYETQVLLNVDIAHKLIRTDTVLDIMYNEYLKRESQDDIRRAIIGGIVLTRYNNRTYRVDDIDFDLRVTDKFKLSNGTEISYEDYFMQHYQEKVTDPDQPLLVSRPKDRDRERGRGSSGPVYLIPQFCILTGISDDMRADFHVMRDIAVHTRIEPEGRIQRLQNFRNSFDENPQVRQTVQDWGMSFSPQLVDIKARVVAPVGVFLANNVQLRYNPVNADWSQEMRGQKIVLPVQLNTWIVLFPRRLADHANDLVRTLQRVGPPMGMNFAQPQLIEMNDDRNGTYVQTLKDYIRPETQMVVCIVPNQKKDRYDAIKKLCVCEIPVPSQVVVQRTLAKKQMLMSVATKIAIQLNCKLGGEVWALSIPYNTPFMVIGIDTYHDSAVKKRSVGGVVCSLNKNCTRFYSRVTFQESHVELVNGLTTICTAALKKFVEVNKGRLPERIFIYRDGVGDGQLDAVFQHEMPQVMNSFRLSGQPDYKPKLAFIVVKKRINTRFFAKTDRPGGAGNPAPGTVVDSVVTNRNWYDFFLISQSVRQGTVSPTHYNVIWDDTQEIPDRMQRFSYMMTHLYYNWPGTIRVPAPCQYAHKLAFLVGQSIHREPSLHLADKLYYL